MSRRASGEAWAGAASPRTGGANVRGAGIVWAIGTPRLASGYHRGTVQVRGGFRCGVPGASMRTPQARSSARTAEPAWPPRARPAALATRLGRTSAVSAVQR
jgi:hypothetical protein